MTRMTGGLLAAFIVVAVLAACEPTEPPAFARRSSAPATARPSATAAPASGGPSASAGATAESSPSEGAPTGSPRIEISGTTVKVVGQGEKNTAVFALDGTYNFESTACPGTGVIPFVWVYDEFAMSRGTYVDAKFTVKNLVGNFYLRIQGPPTCSWTVTLTKA